MTYKTLDLLNLEEHEIRGLIGGRFKFELILGKKVGLNEKEIKEGIFEIIDYSVAVSIPPNLPCEFTVFDVERNNTMKINFQIIKTICEID